MDSKYLLPDNTTNADVDQRTNGNNDVVKAPFVVPRLASGQELDATHGMPVSIVSDTTTGPGGQDDADALYTRQARGTLSTGQVSVGVAATLIKAATAGRIGISLVNTGTVTVFIGAANTVTTTIGHAVPAGASFSLDNYAGDLYGIVASGTATVTYGAVA